MHEIHMIWIMKEVIAKGFGEKNVRISFESGRRAGPCQLLCAKEYTSAE